MIEKIIASGQTGVAAAALDIAIKLGLAYGGWCREGEPAAEKYRLKRLPGACVSDVVEKAVGAGHGTLYFAEGEKISLRLEATKKIIFRMNKPLLVLNLAREMGFAASRRAAEWITENRIKVLHVDGEADSRPERVASILEATFFLGMMEPGITTPLQAKNQRNRKVERGVAVESIAEAVDHLEKAMSLKDRATIANMAAGELVSLHGSLGEYINRHFDLFAAGSVLLTDCRRRSGRWELPATDAAAVIIRDLWDRLRTTYRLRVVK